MALNAMLSDFHLDFNVDINPGHVALATVALVGLLYIVVTFPQVHNPSPYLSHNY